MNTKEVYKYLARRQDTLKGEINEIKDFLKNEYLPRCVRSQSENLLRSKQQELVAIDSILEGV